MDYRQAEGKVCILYGHGAFTIENAARPWGSAVQLRSCGRLVSPVTGSMAVYSSLFHQYVGSLSSALETVPEPMRSPKGSWWYTCMAAGGAPDGQFINWMNPSHPYLPELDGVPSTDLTIPKRSA